MFAETWELRRQGRVGRAAEKGVSTKGMRGDDRRLHIKKREMIKVRKELGERHHDTEKSKKENSEHGELATNVALSEMEEEGVGRTLGS